MKRTVLIAQFILMLGYAVFFVVTPALLDNPSDTKNVNWIYAIPTAVLVLSLLGFVRPRLAARLMFIFAASLYVAFVWLDHGHLKAFAYSLGPAWPPLLAGIALSWIGRRDVFA
jgi:hypothetical protein